MNTRHPLANKARASLVATLNDALAQALDLSLVTKHAHWNVRGPNFIALHELFDKLHDGVDGHVDELAERITALGGIAHGTAQAVAKASAFPSTTNDASTLIAALADRYGHLAATLRQGIAAADKHGDDVTADLFTSIAADVEKDLWFLEAHLDDGAAKKKR